MEGSYRGKLAMFLAVKAVCDARPSVWQRSEIFEDPFTDFCACVDNIIRLLPATGGIGTAASGIAVEVAVADRILTTDMDEFMDEFMEESEMVDVAFVDDYTAARSMDVPDKKFKDVPLLPV
jgi:hypothetical protein